MSGERGDKRHRQEDDQEGDRILDGMMTQNYY